MRRTIVDSSRSMLVDVALNTEDMVLEDVYASFCPPEGSTKTGDLYGGNEFENQNFSPLTIFPNPNTGHFEILYFSKDDFGEIEYSICNFNGVVIYSNKENLLLGSNHLELDLSDQPAGVYFLKFIAEGQVILEKLILR